MNFYYNELENVEGISLRQFADCCKPVHWMMTLTLDDKYNRDDFLLYMKGNGIDCRQMIHPVHRAEHFQKLVEFNVFNNSEYISDRSVHLPSSTLLKKSEINKISTIIKKYL